MIRANDCPDKVTLCSACVLPLTSDFEFVRLFFPFPLTSSAFLYGRVVYLIAIYMSAYVQQHKLSGAHAQGTSIGCLAFSPTGKYLASGGDDFSATIWRVLDGRHACRLLFHSPVDAFLWHPTQPETLILGCRDGTISQSRNFGLVRVQDIRVSIAHNKIDKI